VTFPDIPGIEKRRGQDRYWDRAPATYAGSHPHIELQMDTINRSGSRNYGLPRMADHVLDALLSAHPSAGEDPTEHKGLR
jgi:hypothetical protein